MNTVDQADDTTGSSAQTAEGEPDVGSQEADKGHEKQGAHKDQDPDATKSREDKVDAPDKGRRLRSGLRELKNRVKEVVSRAETSLRKHAEEIPAKFRARLESALNYANEALKSDERDRIKGALEMLETLEPLEQVAFPGGTDLWERGVDKEAEEKSPGQQGGGIGKWAGFGIGKGPGRGGQPGARETGDARDPMFDLPAPGIALDPLASAALQRTARDFSTGRVPLPTDPPKVKPQPNQNGTPAEQLEKLIQPQELTGPIRKLTRELKAARLDDVSRQLLALPGIYEWLILHALEVEKVKGSDVPGLRESVLQELERTPRRRFARHVVDAVAKEHGLELK